MLRRIPYVASLGVPYEHDTRSHIADVLDGLLQGSQTLKAQSLVECQVGLVGAHQVASGLHYGLVERRNVADGHLG